ncbi:MAG: multicopper oxidase domain-containing protein [Spirochaetaceae bacterium]|nr:multicopper oxidase domain-containing protein [Spirochaetaceae bacterium]
MKTIFVGFALLTIAVLFPAFADNAAETLPIPPLLESEILRDGTKLFRLEADEGEKKFLNGKTTRTLGYNGDYPGPTIRFTRVKNSLRDPTTAHWHGADVPAESDGGPHQGIAPGAATGHHTLVSPPFYRGHRRTGV